MRKIKNDQKSSLFSVLIYFYRAIRPQWLLFTVAVFSSIIGFSLLIFTPIQYKKFVDILTNNPSDYHSLLIVLFKILAINMAFWLLIRIVTFTQNAMQPRASARLRNMAFEYLINHSHNFFANNFSGALVQKVNRLAKSFERINDKFIWNVIPLITGVIGSLIVIYTYSISVFLVICFSIITIVVCNVIFWNWEVKYSLLSAEADSNTTALLSDNITNQNTISIFSAIKREILSFRKTTDAQARANMISWNLIDSFLGFQGFVFIFTEFLLFYLLLNSGHNITAGLFVLIQSYYMSFTDKLWNIGKLMKDFYEAFADSQEMVEIMETEHEIRDIVTAKPLIIKKSDISFKKVTFSFNSTRSIFDQIDLNIVGGTKVALIGPSGAGKSSLVKCLLRFYDITAGEILIDDQNIKNVTQESLRNSISMVPQDPILFHRTLKENIAYGKPDASMDEIRRSAELAHCAEFIEKLPDQYETYVGERGIKLSGGERQRIAIARAILRNAPILVLDEATSSLDSESENLIQDALKNLMKDKTTIVIAHRLSTIKSMDRIIVLDEGKIIEDGKHDELINNENSLYKKLWSLQVGGFIDQ